MNDGGIEDYYPLSPMQQGMMFHSMLAPGSGVYVEQLACTLRGDLDVAAFERAWQQVVDHHSILRTGFVGEGLKEPVQAVHRQVTLPLERQDWRGVAPAEQSRRLEALLAGIRQRGFVLSQPPLMRLDLIQTADDEHRLVWSHHHILLDGWSMPLVLREVFTCYEATRRGLAWHPEPARPYRDYIVWLRRQSAAAAESYWRKALRGFTAPTPLAIGRPRQAAGAGESQTGRCDSQLPPPAFAALEALSRRHQLTLNTLVQGAWSILLSRYSREEDVVFGATVSGRPPDLAGSETMVGLFINTLPVRVRVDPDAELLGWLKGLQAQQVELRQYEHNSLIQIQGWSEVPRGEPLFDSLLVFENYPVTPSSGQPGGGGGSLELADVQAAEQTNYPLVLTAAAREGLTLGLMYDRGEFEPAAAERALGHLGTLLAGLAGGLERPLRDLPMLTADERRQLVEGWNATAAEYPRDRCLHELFEAQVVRSPEAVAVRLGGKRPRAGEGADPAASRGRRRWLKGLGSRRSGADPADQPGRPDEPDELTYEALNRRANQVARHLRGLGVQPEAAVGICVERSLDMVVGLLGILKAGAAYVPLDPAYPAERLAFMLEDSGSQIVLTQGRLAERLGETLGTSGRMLVRLDSGWGEIARESEENPPRAATPEGLAYLIYTSGSTGRPKGVALEHRNVVSFLHWASSAFSPEALGGVLFSTSICFDLSVFELFAPLSVGGTAILVENALALATLTEADGVRLLNTVPSAMAELTRLAAVPSSVRVVNLAGEPLRGVLAQQVYEQPGVEQVFNLYGPSETTTYSTYGLVERGAKGEPTIGRPIANTRLYVLDGQGALVPVGVPGELYIGGAGVARGYLNRPELTAERFVADRFAPEPGARLYRTGDLVRWLPGGDLEYLGRIDNQVKVRGYRIELGEVEAALLEQPGVRSSVVVVREDSVGDARLVAYVQVEGEPGPTVESLRTALQRKLPGYMVPSALVALERLPLTPNGKVDRKALPAPEGARPTGERAAVAPRDDLEQELKELWETVLGVKPIGVTDDFFSLGGHSLTAMRLIAQVRQRYGKDIPLTALFLEPTIARLAQVIRERQQTALSSVVACLQPGDAANPPIFLVHPSGGQSYWYIDLARELESSQPVYGIQVPLSIDGRGYHPEIKEMATRYIAAMRAIQADGPYLVGGWCFGGIVAYEMAQQLHRQGEEVALLAVVEQSAFSDLENPCEDDAGFLVEMFHRPRWLSIDHLRTLEPDAMMAYTLDVANQNGFDKIRPGMKLEEFRRLALVSRGHAAAWQRYQLEPYPGKVTLFRVKRQHGEGARYKDLGWGPLALDGVEIHHLPGDHDSIVEPPDVRALARELGACIRRARGLAEPAGDEGATPASRLIARGRRILARGKATTGPATALADPGRDAGQAGPGRGATPSRE